MRKHPSYSVAMVRTDEVDTEDRMYAVTPVWFSVDKLRESIRTLGLVVPLRLESREQTRLRLVSGFRRLRVAQELGLTEIPCIISAAKVPREVFVEVLGENLGCRPFTEIEKAVALLKLKSQFELQQSELIQVYLPLLGIPADRYHLDRYLSIARLPEIIQRAMFGIGLCTDIALELCKWDTREQSLIIELVARYRLGRNKQKELFEVLRDLRSIMKKSVDVVWEESGSGEIDANMQLSPQDRLAGIKKLLRAQRYPNLAQHEELWGNLRNSLGLPSGVRLDVPPYFEGRRISIRIEAASAGELRSLVRQSRDLLDREELDRIFTLL